jgi:hypothetical protein
MGGTPVRAAVTLGELLKSDQAFAVAAEQLKLDGENIPEMAGRQLIKREAKAERVLITLTHKNLGRFQMMVRVPTAAYKDEKPRPVIFLTSGVLTGLKTLDLIEDAGEAIIAAYDYPINKELERARLAGDIMQNLPRIYGQIAASMKWLSRQSIVRADRINSIHVSFGSFIAPLSLRLANAMGVETYATVFAFGGAEVWNLAPIAASSRLTEDEVAEIKRQLALALKGIDSASHLPHLKGRFLAIRGTKDEIIPEASALALERALPEPKQIELLDSEHIGSDRLDIIQQTFSIIKKWLAGVGALN